MPSPNSGRAATYGQILCCVLAQLTLLSGTEPGDEPGDSIPGTGPSNGLDPVGARSRSEAKGVPCTHWTGIRWAVQGPGRPVESRDRPCWPWAGGIHGPAVPPD